MKSLEVESLEDSGAPAADGGAGEFTLPEDSLRRLARRYPARLEVGWWRTRATLGEFSPRDFRTQAELVGPDGVGLLVYGSGPHWGTAYLGPDGHAPDTAGTLVTVSASPGPPPGAGPAPPPAAEPGPELVDITAGEHISQEPIPMAEDVEGVKWTGLTAAGAGRPLRKQASRRSSTRARRRAAATAGQGMPASAKGRLWGPAGAPGEALGEVLGGPPPPEPPPGVRLVAGGLAVAAGGAADIIGVLLHSALATVLIAAVALLAVFFSVWLSRRL